MADVKALAESLVALTVKEVQELADVLKADYGIEPAAAVVVAGDGGGGAAAAGARARGGRVILRRCGPPRQRALRFFRERASVRVFRWGRLLFAPLFPAFP